MFILPSTVREAENSVAVSFGRDSKIFRMFKHCFLNTLATTTKQLDDNSFFVFTGDIPAMWLRDSSAQVRHYIPFAKDDNHLQELIEGLIKRQIQCIRIDPYANSFNERDEGYHYKKDRTFQSPYVWERKYELDSLCYPMQIAYLYWKETGKAEHLDENFSSVMNILLNLWETEQNHELSIYTFERPDDVETDTLQNKGRGTPVKSTGMTWSGFRPSDDACQYGYLIPSNMFASVVLDYMEEIASHIYRDEVLEMRCRNLKNAIKLGIENYAVFDHREFGKIYAYETDGFGNHNLMDDANVPSLLSLPYLGYCNGDDQIYQNTRKFILSSHNPYFYNGKYAKGIGSPHTPPNYIWHISLIMQGLTSTDKDEIYQILKILETTDGGTGFMHEGFCADDPDQYTREWFAWANSLFSEFILLVSKLNFQN